MTKRQETGRRMGRQWKELGHAREHVFNALFHRRGPLNTTGASADCEVNDETAERLADLGVIGRRVSLKGGASAQFHLGVIEELSDKEEYKNSLTTRMVRDKPATCGTHSVNWYAQQQVLRDESFWQRRLGKGDYYCQIEKDNKGFTFFSMADVIRFIVEKTRWRLLETGRIKGDLPRINKDKSATLVQVLTFEYREEHDSFVLGAHGSRNGYKFCYILKQHIKYKTLNG